MHSARRWLTTLWVEAYEPTHSVLLREELADDSGCLLDDRLRELSSAQARTLAADLLAAADRVDALPSKVGDAS